MKSKLNHRSFLKRAPVAAGTLSAAPFTAGPNLLLADQPNKKLNCVQIGCGGRAMTHLEWLVTQSKDNVVAIVDPDQKQYAKVKKLLKTNGLDADKLQLFDDYRVMFDK